MIKQADRQWYAVRVKPRQEQITKIHYTRQGYKVYLPLVQATRRHARRTDICLRPFFPGYLFLHLAQSERNWTTISSTIGSIGPIRFGDYYPRVPEWVIENLQHRENSNKYIPMCALGNAAVKKGDRITVSIGSRDTEAIFLQFKGEDRVVLLLNLLQRQSRVEVPLDRMQMA